MSDPHDIRDTDELPVLPPDALLPREARATARSNMSDRELLLSLHSRLDGIDDRLRSGDERSARLELEWVVAMRYLHSVNLYMGRREEASEIDAVISLHRPTNGHDDGASEQDTNPGE